MTISDCLGAPTAARFTQTLDATLDQPGVASKGPSESSRHALAWLAAAADHTVEAAAATQDLPVLDPLVRAA